MPSRCTSDLKSDVRFGKWIGESSYHWRADRYQELTLEAAKIDYYDPINKTVHEVKKSNKMEKAQCGSGQILSVFAQTERY